MRLLESATFVYWYCGIGMPVTLAIGLWARAGANAASARNRERIAIEAREAQVKRER